ncbi:uracil-DNA glycosylase [Oscillochloris sp. ZM17-4]|uniref:uracil-DNA glycosylase n=1 Tax=Oscillochloris sp. ZM17-4 TaxID=2866714 RepID=UPI001C72A4A8|nr:uracil-DNA glycosylase [Oscillochloris sp. ZM17-4]MBX0329744.1 uracil-DNA glycosylase [Oscillochloris sp. ZM17-4]
MTLVDQLPPDWRAALSGERDKPYLARLEAFLAEERTRHTVFPPEGDVFAALRLTPYGQVRALIVGQDPYHDDGQAHGLAFSVRRGVRVPPSLVNIYKELEADLGIPRAGHGSLERWAAQGVLLLNTSLTVRAHAAASHKGRGWEQLTDAVIRAVNARPQRAVFVLWGGHAQKKRPLIDGPQHVVVESAHPSPLSARGGFFGSRPFSAINRALEEVGVAPIDWRLEAA